MSQGVRLSESDRIVASAALPAPVLCVLSGRAYILSPDGEITAHSLTQAAMLAHKTPMIVCHAPHMRSRLGAQADLRALDVLELFAFVHPGMFCVPTVPGLCRALGLGPPADAEDHPGALLGCVRALLSDLVHDPHAGKADPVAIAAIMGQQGRAWPWTPFVFAARGAVYDPAQPLDPRRALSVWKHLLEWAEDPPLPPPAQHGVSGAESRERLRALLGHDSEQREAQMEYATQMSAVFSPVQEAQAPHVVLLEAGTGTGKTLGYLAPASLWAEKNDGAVWISTFTRNLQRQIDQELTRLYPDPALKGAHVAVRKGRENYLCLLNLEEAGLGVPTTRHAEQAIAAGIMARWAAVTRDGDLSGADFPGWLAGILGARWTTGLSDRRGECIYGACDHYRKCFIERSIRKSRRARIVVANHALVMVNAAISDPEGAGTLPARYIFDEAHHLFDAADSAFAAHLTGREAQDLRRWLRGPEGGPKSRARGLQKRVESLISGDAEAQALLQDILQEAGCLPAAGWGQRLAEKNPQGPCEVFLAALMRQVYARAEGREGPYSLETPTFPLNEDIPAAAKRLEGALNALRLPMQKLATLLRARLESDEAMQDADTRRRMDALCIALERRYSATLAAWIDMLGTLLQGAPAAGMVDWMEITRIEGRVYDAGFFRHHLDPMKAFAAALRPHVHGMGLTSATLRDPHGPAETQEADMKEDTGWRAARLRTGADYLTPRPHCLSLESPFDYAAQTRIFILSDVRKDNTAQVAGAVRALFESSGGGALGLFTAVQRLRAVQEKIHAPLEAAGIHLYAQHIDAMDNGTLVDIFRDDTHACLLGTDAVRDGVDVPGESLRLMVFDRVPWPRPTILHGARRSAFGKKDYDEMLTRLRLRQAFGRLIRRSADRGVFVMLDSMFPSRLHSAFPEGAPIVKCGLAEAAAAIRDFLKTG